MTWKPIRNMTDQELRMDLAYTTYWLNHPKAHRETVLNAYRNRIAAIKKEMEKRANGEA